MNEYDKALAHMGAAPLEPDEPGGPGRRPGSPGGNRNRWANHEKRTHATLRIDAAVYNWLSGEAKAQGVTISEYINSLLRAAYEAGR